MRDVLVLAIILGSAPICLFSPYFGVLVWTWVAYFNPHKYAWTVAPDFQVAQVIAIPTILGAFFAREKNRHFLTPETVLLLLFWAWSAFTLLHASRVPIFAGTIEEGKEALTQVSKILFMTLLMIVLITSKKKLRGLLLVTVFSFGLIALKGTIFGILTGGQQRVYGPDDSFISDNNGLALALNMTLPMFYFLAKDEEKKWLRLALRLSMLFVVMAIILTFSRGGMLGLATVLAVLAVKARKKMLSAFLVSACVLLVFSFAPEKWMIRMGTFLQGNLDQSAQFRLNAWEFAWKLALDYPLTGGGFKVFTPELFERYTPHLHFAGAHSIYFQVLAEHGFVGLGLFLALLAGCWLTVRVIRSRARHLPAGQWFVLYSHMFEVSIAAFVISGAFLEFAYFDLYFQVVACTAILRILYKEEVREAAGELEFVALEPRPSRPVTT